MSNWMLSGETGNILPKKQRYWMRGLLFALGVAVQTVAGVAGAATEVRVILVLERQRNDLAELARKVSDPNNTAFYGDYRTVESIADTYGPSNQTIDHVQNFLAGITGVNIVGMDHTHSFALTLMNKQAVIHIFGEVPSQVSPPVPGHLSGYVTHILGAFDHLTETHPFQEPPQHPQPLPLPMRRAYERTADRLLGTDPWPSWAMGSGAPENCPVMHASEGSCENDWYQPHGSGNANFRSFTPNQLRTAYGFEASGFTGEGRTAVVIQEKQVVDTDDIDRYATGFGLTFRSTPNLEQFRMVDIPEYRSTAENFEATLDVETIVGLAKGVHRIYVWTIPYETTGQWLAHYPLIISEALIGSPDVISVSYGSCEDTWDHEGAAETIEVLELVFQIAATAGVTVIYSSGDQGSSACVTREGPTPWLPNRESVQYPASSPWVTAVGGTNLRLNANNSIAEAQVWNDWPLKVNYAIPSHTDNPCDTPPCHVANLWAGGGGASTRFDAPSWQQNTGHSKRMTPDIAYMADLYPGTLIYHKGKWLGGGNGTSLATPIFAAAVLLLNEFRIKNNRPKIGFASPLLYSWGKSRTKRNAFLDVTKGNNKIGSNTTQFTQLTCCDAGPGWDAATGWGSLFVHRAMNAFRESDGAHVSFVGRASTPHHQGLVAHGADPSKQIHHANTGAPIPHPHADSISGVYTQLATVDSFNKSNGSESDALTTLPAGAHGEPGHGLSWIGLTDTDAYPIWLSAMGFELDILSAADYYFDTANDIETRIYRGGTISLFEDAEGVVTEIWSYSDAVATMVIDWNFHGTETSNITVDVDLPIGPLQIRSTETIQVDGSTALGPYSVFDILGTDLALVPEPSSNFAMATALLSLAALRRRLH